MQNPNQKKKKYNQESIWTPGIIKHDKSAMKSWETVHQFKSKEKEDR